MKTLRQALILSSHREYAQTLRQGLLKLGDDHTRIDVEIDGLRAMQLAPQQYELILLDRTLDSMDGLQLLQIIKQQAPVSKFIIVSDSGDEASRAMAYQSGADFFLERPRTPPDFALALEAIKGLLKSIHAEQPAPDAAEDTLVVLADIIQMRCLSGDSVLLLVRSEAQSGDIFIFRGEVYHAQYPGKGGEAAFQDMLRWDGGKVRLKAVKLIHVPPRTIEVSYRQLLQKAKGQNHSETRTLQGDGELYNVTKVPTDSGPLSVAEEAPPLRKDEAVAFPPTQPRTTKETQLPRLNSHWQVSLSGDLMEGSNVIDADRCAFITTFIFRKMADVAVALEVDYFDHLTLLGPHLQQILVADNLGVRHAVFETPWTNEEMRVQYVKWCREQSL